MLLGDRVNAAPGGGVSGFGAYMSSSSTSRLPAVLSVGGVDVGGFADRAVHDFEPGVFEVRNPNQVGFVAHTQILGFPMPP